MSPALLVSFLLLACTNTDPQDSGQGDGGSPGDGGGQAGDGGSEAPVPGPLSGEWLVTISIAPVGGLDLPFHLELVNELQDGEDWIRSASLRATDGADAQSEVLATTTEIQVQADRSFTLDFPVFTLPGEYSPTSGEVDVQPTLSSTGLSEAGTFCGEVDGEIVTFEIDLEGSTFGARPWADRAEGGLDSCDPGGGKGIPRLTAKDCPTLQAGSLTGFPSGGGARSAQIVLPSAYDASTSWPLAFAWHGFGGTAEDLVDLGLREMADEWGVILIAPQAEDLGGSIAWDVVSGEQNNLDLAFFDDLLTCAGASFHLDPDRVWSTGMSNGGLMTGMLMAQRAGTLAAAAPLSGGMFLDPAKGSPLPPTLVTWGGETDLAFEQDFNAYALDMIATVQADGSFVAACDHGLGHTLEADFWPWVFHFLVDHPRGVSPEPYMGGLPGDFPDYCLIPD